MKVQRINEIVPLAKTYHLPGREAGGALIIIVPEDTNPHLFDNPILDENGEPPDILPNRIYFCSSEWKIFHAECSLCGTALEVLNTDEQRNKAF